MIFMLYVLGFWKENTTTATIQFLLTYSQVMKPELIWLSQRDETIANNDKKIKCAFVLQNKLSVQRKGNLPFPLILVDMLFKYTVRWVIKSLEISVSLSKGMNTLGRLFPILQKGESFSDSCLLLHTELFRKKCLSERKKSTS